jgi:hypothetical protein
LIPLSPSVKICFGVACAEVAGSSYLHNDFLPSNTTTPPCCFACSITSQISIQRRLAKKWDAFKLTDTDLFILGRDKKALAWPTLQNHLQICSSILLNPPPNGLGCLHQDLTNVMMLTARDPYSPLICHLSCKTSNIKRCKPCLQVRKRFVYDSRPYISLTSQLKNALKVSFLKPKAS